MNKLVFVIAALVALLSAAAIVIPMQRNSPSLGPFVPTWLTSPNNEISASQLGSAYSAHGLSLELPSQLPRGLSLSSVHVPDVNSPYGYAMLTYSANGVKDFRYAEVDIELIPGSAPSASELNVMANAEQGIQFQQLAINGIPVLLNPQAQIGDPELQKQFGPDTYALFWAGGVYYQIRAYHPLTADDVLGMIATLQLLH